MIRNNPSYKSSFKNIHKKWFFYNLNFDKVILYLIKIGYLQLTIAFLSYKIPYFTI